MFWTGLIVLGSTCCVSLVGLIVVLSTHRSVDKGRRISKHRLGNGEGEVAKVRVNIQNRSTRLSRLLESSLYITINPSANPIDVTVLYASKINNQQSIMRAGLGVHDQKTTLKNSRICSVINKTITRLDARLPCANQLRRGVRVPCIALRCLPLAEHLSESTGRSSIYTATSAGNSRNTVQ